jgi:hypothetical protein
MEFVKSRNIGMNGISNHLLKIVASSMQDSGFQKSRKSTQAGGLDIKKDLCGTAHKGQCLKAVAHMK